METYDPGVGVADNLSPEQRLKFGLEWFEYVMTFGLPEADTAYRKAGIGNFVFGEMWSRPGLTLKERRWLTLACVAASDAHSPIQSHVYASLKSGDISYAEMMEAVLHIAVYLGWPKASYLEQVVRDEWKKIEAAGGTVTMTRPTMPSD